MRQSECQLSETNDTDDAESRMARASIDELSGASTSTQFDKRHAATVAGCGEISGIACNDEQIYTASPNVQVSGSSYRVCGSSV